MKKSQLLEIEKAKITTEYNECSIYDISKIYNKKINEIDMKIYDLTSRGRDEIIEKYSKTRFDEDVTDEELLIDEKFEVTHTFKDNILYTKVLTNDYNYEYTFDGKDIKFTKEAKSMRILNTTMLIFSLMQVKESLNNQLRGLEIENTTLKTNISESNISKATYDDTFISSSRIYLENEKGLITIDKTMKDIKLDKNVVPAWISSEIDQKQKSIIKKIFKRR